jgi:hypothetical protein
MNDELNQPRLLDSCRFTPASDIATNTSPPDTAWNGVAGGIPSRNAAGFHDAMQLSYCRLASTDGGGKLLNI